MDWLRKGVSTQPANGDAKAAVTYREIEFLADSAQALRLLELEEEGEDPEVLTVPRDRLASGFIATYVDDGCLA